MAKHGQRIIHYVRWVIRTACVDDMDGIDGVYSIEDTKKPGWHKMTRDRINVVSALNVYQ